eukprot:TRINITY_DN3240_c0_g4_i1.p1 TRINITY_DN3240_c0_g4~~TRINITY_DN3240_c0_g4_i1.p1  ORF type:complete len:269 (-),score=61.49 TRINITY_DN3240_c0_g4_i1:100-837(-)
MAGEEDLEYTLLICNECHVYRIPPRVTSAGYKCSDWKEEDHLWTGRVRMTARGETCLIKLEDPNSGELFAECPVPPDGTGVERVLDSSRYFVLRIDDGSGRHAFIGMGFADRNTAFDFNAAIQDHIKGIKAEKEAAAVASNPGPSKDYSLKQGETIRINIKKGKGKGTGAAPAAAAGGLAAPAMGMVGLKLTPPPPAGQQKRGHQGQVPQQQQQQQQQQQPKEDEWGDFGSASNNAGGGNDWVTF